MAKNILDMPSSLPGLMASGKNFHFSINTRLELTENIDPAVFECAVERARARYPYYYIRLVRGAEDKLQIETNPAPLVVRGKPEPPLLLSAESNGHMQAFSFTDNVLWHHIHHAFSDGRSISRYLQTVLYLYFSEKYHRDFNSPGVHLPGEDILPEETIDPQLQFYPQLAERLQNHSLVLNPPPAGFGWKSRFIVDKKPTFYCLKVPEDAFVRYSKDKDSSPATLPVVFMLRSIYALHDTNLPVNASIMADCRTGLGCEAFMGPCVSPVRITYPPDLRKWGIQDIATVTRGSVILQTWPDNIRQKQLQDTTLTYLACQSSSKKETKEMLSGFFIPKEKDSSMTIGCSYPGAIQWGELNEFLSDMYAVLDPSADSMTFALAVSAVNGHFSITIIQNFSSDAYVRQFCEELEKEGIPHTCSEAQPVHIAKTADIKL